MSKISAHLANSYYTLINSYCTLCVEKHTILGPAVAAVFISTKLVHTGGTITIHCPSMLWRCWLSRVTIKLSPKWLF